MQQLLTHPCLEIYLTIAVRNFQTFENNLGMKHTGNFAKYLKEGCR